MSEACSWCGVQVGEDEGFRATEPAGDRIASFCRLEHVVPWIIQGPRWEPGRLPEVDEDNGYGLGRCAHCAAPLDDRYVLLVRRRGRHRIADAFCSTDHLLAWSKAGGRYRGAA